MIFRFISATVVERGTFRYVGRREMRAMNSIHRIAGIFEDEEAIEAFRASRIDTAGEAAGRRRLAASIRRLLRPETGT